ncbi:hypothetical protein DPMN_173679 [Dreissena polymorpha]|uniref:Uncharacterized protein n=1 Tax=Dreissena polymorpha TaxID=45954 RepID=A0A9D4IH60_DREPO|nr:hypothetical protein DPMN_173679 [Dreissena polymorpha]
MNRSLLIVIECGRAIICINSLKEKSMTSGSLARHLALGTRASAEWRSVALLGTSDLPVQTARFPLISGSLFSDAEESCQYTSRVVMNLGT